MNNKATYFFKKYSETQKIVSRKKVGNWIKNVFDLLFPVDLDQYFNSEEDFIRHFGSLKAELNSILSTINHYDIDNTVEAFFDELPAISQVLETDIVSIYMGDPAAQSEAEVVRCYPGVFAIAAYRIAHKLDHLNVKVIPRMITEYAHSKTGIDIHPQAQIDKHFFIDHGTGVVIGATAIIGKNVKIYQGVTLGGLSVRKEDATIKRHPTIEDNVVIYAGATILGGKTVIGHNSIIGGNTFITKSVPPNSKVYYSQNNEVVK